MRRIAGLVDWSYYVGHGKTFRSKVEQELTEQTEFLSQPISVSSVSSCVIPSVEGRVTSGKQDTGKTAKRIWHFPRNTPAASLVTQHPTLVTFFNSTPDQPTLIAQTSAAPLIDRDRGQFALPLYRQAARGCKYLKASNPIL
jgi:hypothetical protein